MPVCGTTPVYSTTLVCFVTPVCSATPVCFATPVYITTMICQPTFFHAETCMLRLCYSTGLTGARQLCCGTRCCMSLLQSWVFRYGGRHLLPRKTTQEGMDPDEKYSLLVLEETASRSQKAFAACGTSVAV